MKHSELKKLSHLATEAAAALIPLAADPRGRDHHGGTIPNRAAVIARALDKLERAGRTAAELRRVTREGNR